MLLFSAYLGQLCPKQHSKLNNYRYYGNGYADPVLQTQYIEVNTKTYHTVNDFQIIKLFNQMTRRNHFIESTVRTKGCLTYITILLMAISNDVQLNPGPTNNDSTIYGCGTCNQPVTWDHRAVVCDTCDQWYHNLSAVKKYNQEHTAYWMKMTTYAGTVSIAITQTTVLGSVTIYTI